ncbi:DEAD/DEAH box helicase [Corynebacterium camporealensis]|uniref:DEAD/DEAH box helicase n=1 Tax=Corynebacterium camporealensis TaxID=161896 RepID=UPI0034CDE02D
MSSLIPTYAADHISDGLSEYLTTSFSLAEDLTAQQLRAFLQDPKGGMFYGPYVRTRLPYAAAERKDWEGLLGWLPKGFQPYRHQAEAFARLSSRDAATGEVKRPDPTLVVTGTGSGKTEAFLYPIVDHCRRVGGKGIKALIMYPMNALAADQERRLAKLLSEEAALAGVSAGLYTGEVATGGRRVVSERGLITDRSVIRDSPPDILLTNYKMLDQLLLRDADQMLWEKSAETLQYLVLDEFHTYDAAQGTDVAMLLRRLGLMLKKHQPKDFLTAEQAKLPLGRVTPVATSATLGGKAGSSSAGATDMLDFAYTVFGERLEPSSVVGETLLTVPQWQETIPELVGQSIVSSTGPSVDVMKSVVDQVATSADDYDAAVHTAMCSQVLSCDEASIESAIAAMAGNELVLSILQAAASPVPLGQDESLVPDGEHSTVPSLVEQVFDGKVLRGNRELCLEFLAIVLSELAYLRAEFGAQRGWDGKKIPGVETHLWVREISRIDRAVGSVSESDGDDDGSGGSQMFRWSDDGKVALPTGHIDTSHSWLPAIYCRRCGRSGWMLGTQPGGDSYETDPARIRQLFRRGPERQRPLIDATSEVIDGAVRGEEENSRVRWLNLATPELSDAEPSDQVKEQDPVAPVLVYVGDDVEDRAKAQSCPSCGEDDAIRFLGSSVATLLSVALSNLFGMDSLDNGEKKTLVFADSVQDAAYRAGFMQNRARAFALRARIWRAVDSYYEDENEGDVPWVTLDLLAERMVEHARSEEDPAAAARSLYELLPPELAEVHTFKPVWDKDATSDQRRHAKDRLKKRLNLDLALQFGDRVDLPRSLVSTGSLSTSVDVSDDILLDAAKSSLVEVMATDDEVLAWARGVLEQMRIQGGIYHPWFKEYLRNDCNPYMLNKRDARAKGVPAFARGNSPSFPRSGEKLKGYQAKKNNSESMPVDAQQGWYARWTKQALAVSTGSAFAAANAVSELFRQLELAEVLRSVPTNSGGRMYYLEPSKIVVGQESNPEILECTACHMRVGVDSSARSALQGAPCFTLSCPGRYEVTAIEDNYYQQLYRSRNTRTVVSAEHTGLVPTAKRKEIEDQFKLPAEKQQADAPNVLVATPTLEMGIDIGDLSTVMLSSMPRTVASYVQRVGRAGRLTGNSLIVALVRGRGTALTKLEHPLETIAGSVTAPAAYLSARDIMHRQFIAYLIDSNEVEARVGQLHNARNVFSDREENLVGVLEELASQDLTSQLDSFIATLAGHTSEDVLDELREWASEGGLLGELRIARKAWNDTLYQLFDRQAILRERVEDIDSRLSTGIDDEQLQKMRDTTRAALRFANQQIEKHTEEYWIAALERVGLLPNFTLLDDAVEFHLSVSSFDEEKGAFDTSSYDYSRGVSSALTELAPGNTFYVQGIGAQIDSVELGSHNSALTQWRLCPDCSYSEATGAVLSTDDDYAIDAPAAGACPSCGSPAFAERGQLIDVIEMSKVYASVDASKSAISDRDDERRSLMFQTQLSFSVPEGGHGTAWYLAGSGFGMEHLPRVDMRWLNLGKHGGGSKKMLAGSEREAPLFRVCERCGHLDSEAGKNHWSDHAPWCELRDAQDEQVVTFALGRTLSTQGVLIRLPEMLGMLDDSTLPSLVSALLLGFKEYLGGNPEHLNISIVRTESDGQPEEMLLVHDSIPGGTGYLAQFTDPAHVRGLLEVAYKRLVVCACADEERQACPSCLLPYAVSGAVEKTSRQAAVAALAKILADTKHLDTDEDPLAVSWQGRITTEVPERSSRSKLEQRFIEQLRAELNKLNASVTEQTIGGHARWDIDFGGRSGHKWVMEEQVQIGGTVPDVVFSTADNQVRNIALYLDGASFHASEVHNRVGDDFAKRNRLYLSGYLPWTLTWQDIDRQQARGDNEGNQPSTWVTARLRSVLARKLNISNDRLGLLDQGPFSQLLWLLREPEGTAGDVWKHLSQAAFLEAAVGGTRGENGTVHHSYRECVNLVVPKDGAMNHGSLTLDNREQELDQEGWRIFIELSNLAYLNADGANVTVEDSIVEPVVAEDVVVPSVDEEIPESSTSLPAGWEAMVDEFEGEDEVQTALRALAEAGVAAPAEDDIGAEVNQVPVIALWPEAKAVLLFAEDLDDVGEELTAEGYTVAGADFETAPDAFVQVLR